MLEQMTKSKTSLVSSMLLMSHACILQFARFRAIAANCGTRLGSTSQKQRGQGVLWGSNGQLAGCEKPSEAGHKACELRATTTQRVTE
jgi:hypothetical protein